MRKYNFSSEQESEIVALYQNGTSAKEIQDAYGITGVSTIYTILHSHNVPLKTKSPERKIKFVPATPDMVERAFGSFRTPADQKAEEEAVDVDERLPERKAERKRFRLTLKVRLTFDADTMESAIAKAKGYNGFQEVLSISRVG